MARHMGCALQWGIYYTFLTASSSWKLIHVYEYAILNI